MFSVSSFLEIKRKQVVFYHLYHCIHNHWLPSLLTTPVSLAQLFITHIAQPASLHNGVNHNKMESFDFINSLHRMSSRILTNARTSENNAPVLNFAPSAGCLRGNGKWKSDWFIPTHLTHLTHTFIHRGTAPLHCQLALYSSRMDNRSIARTTFSTQNAMVTEGRKAQNSGLGVGSGDGNGDRVYLRLS